LFGCCGKEGVLNNKQLNKQIALYCRTAQYCDTGIGQQQQILRSYAKEHGYTDVKVYTDNGVSGLTLDRPAFSKLQADIQAGLISTVIVKSISQVGRNSLEATQWVWNITEKGVDFISITEPDILSTALDMNIALAIALKGGGAE